MSSIEPGHIQKQLSWNSMWADKDSQNHCDNNNNDDDNNNNNNDNSGNNDNNILLNAEK